MSLRLRQLLILITLLLAAVFASAATNGGETSQSPALQPKSAAEALTANASAGTSGAATGIDRDDSRACMRCHRMTTLAYRDPDTGDVVDLYIDRERYQHATHAALACLDCHGRGYRPYPHRIATADESLDCVACHDERVADGAPDLSGIGDEFRASVHAIGVHAVGVDSPGPEQAPNSADTLPLTCSACHDPHGFRPIAADAPIASVIDTANSPCLECHGDAVTGEPTGHAWLPKAEAHWRSVRCVDCHAELGSGEGRRPSHQVLPAADASPGCVGCHSRNSRLLDALYTHRSRAALAETGWWSQAVNNDAYIIGMSRNDWLDRISLIVIGLLLVGIVAHATGRYLTRHRRGPQ